MWGGESSSNPLSLGGGLKEKSECCLFLLLFFKTFLNKLNRKGERRVSIYN